MYCKFTNEDNEAQEPLVDMAKVIPQLGTKNRSRSWVLSASPHCSASHKVGKECKPCMDKTAFFFLTSLLEYNCFTMVC